jgi:hypothetical protein
VAFGTVAIISLLMRSTSAGSVALVALVAQVAQGRTGGDVGMRGGHAQEEKLE